METLQEISNHLRARTIGLDEAREILTEVFCHMQAHNRFRLLRELHREIERYHDNMPVSDIYRELDEEIARRNQIMQMTTMPIYKFKVDDHGNIGEVRWVDQTTQQLEELLNDEKVNFLSEKEMEI